MVSTTKSSALAPGARVIIRDKEWIVRRVDRTHTNNYALTVTGLSPMVRNKNFQFLINNELDKYETLSATETVLVPDDSPNYRKSRLHIESLLRRTPPTGKHIYLGHRAAMDFLPYQIEPALMALEQPRARILIADAVGIGKTLEAGILISELIRRGRGKRILVVTLKSMLTQFQKEMWNRFTIPLVRLDSIGIQRIREQIPANHNPFYHYDRAIISIDTLKQAREYRGFIEKAHWDIIVIDEAQNVADRGSGRSLRARLAKLLAERSDTLIMLSATPHDGRPRSFASLVNMLDQTIIADPDSYKQEDFEGKNLFIRRFKKDIKNQIRTALPERKTALRYARATPKEERAYKTLADTPSSVLSRKRGTAPLLRTILEKGLFSSPVACQETIRKFRRRLSKDPSTQPEDLNVIDDINEALEDIRPEDFSKYQELLRVIREEMQWKGNDSEDRLVIFTERIRTLKFLSKTLQNDLGLKDGAIRTLYGEMGDIEQQEIVESFGRKKSPVRLLIASDVASEGINLHFLCHRMIHFDIPWSLMIFQQRNGRIDRYGQTEEPTIYYLLTESENEKIRGDIRILELLIRKEAEAIKNIGDPAAFIGVYDTEEEEKFVTGIIEQGMSPGAAEKYLDKGISGNDNSIFNILTALQSPPTKNAESQIKQLNSLFPSDYDYLKAVLQEMTEVQVTIHNDEKKYLRIVVPNDLRRRFSALPQGARPDNAMVDLCELPEIITNEIKRCRAENDAWPQIQYLWPLHPVVDWATDKVETFFDRKQAPVLALPSDTLAPNEVVFVISVLFANRKGHPVLQKQYAVRILGDTCTLEPLEKTKIFDLLRKGTLPNSGSAPVGIQTAEKVLRFAIEEVTREITGVRKTFLESTRKKLDKQLDALERFRRRSYERIEKRYEKGLETVTVALTRKEKHEVDSKITRYHTWISDTMEIEEKPYIQVFAALINSDAHGI